MYVVDILINNYKENKMNYLIEDYNKSMSGSVIDGTDIKVINVEGDNLSSINVTVKSANTYSNRLSDKNSVLNKYSFFTQDILPGSIFWERALKSDVEDVGKFVKFINEAYHDFVIEASYEVKYNVLKDFSDFIKWNTNSNVENEENVDVSVSIEPIDYFTESDLKELHKARVGIRIRGEQVREYIAHKMMGFQHDFLTVVKIDKDMNTALMWNKEGMRDSVMVTNFKEDHFYTSKRWKRYVSLPDLFVSSDKMEQIFNNNFEEEIEESFFLEEFERAFNTEVLVVIQDLRNKGQISEDEYYEQSSHNKLKSGSVLFSDSFKPFHAGMLEQRRRDERKLIKK